jgi:transcriptional regulator with XRE-family HTH domain
MSAFAKRLKQLRTASGLSQTELADRAGMNRFGIAKLEQGVREPSWGTALRLAKALGVSVAEFATKDEITAGATRSNAKKR